MKQACCSSKNKSCEFTRLYQYFQLHLCLRHHCDEIRYWRRVDCYQTDMFKWPPIISLL